MNKILELNLGERIVLNQLAVNARGTSSLMRTVKRAKYAIAAREIPDPLMFGDIWAKDGETRECEFDEDTFKWVCDTFAAKQDWQGQFADWVDSLQDKLTSARMAGKE